MWNPTARALHSRAELRYGSDLTDAEWAIVAPLLPKPCDRGRHRRWSWREILDAIFDVLPPVRLAIQLAVGAPVPWDDVMFP